MADPFNIDAARAAIAEADAALIEACRKGHIVMRIPAQQDDTDLVIGKALNIAIEAIAEIQRMRDAALRQETPK